MEDALERMRSLLGTQDLYGGHYALLYDRVEVFHHRDQVFGTQMICKGGHWQPAPIVDPNSVNVRRRQIGMTTTREEYEQNFQTPCVG